MPEIFNSTTLSAKFGPQADDQTDNSTDSVVDPAPFSASQAEFDEQYHHDQPQVSYQQHHGRPTTHPAQPVSNGKKALEEYSEVMRVEKPSQNPLDAFAPRPIETYFDSQEKEEQVVLLLRQHPITQIKWVLIALGMIFFPMILSALPLETGLTGMNGLAALVGWYLLTTGFIIESFLSWFFNVYIITDERVIDVDFISLIYKHVSAAKLDNIEDITAITGGAMRSIFDMGTIIIQTAGATQQLEFADVPHPAKVTRLLNELLLEEEREKIEGRVN